GAVACSLATMPALGFLRGVPDGAGGAYLVWNEGLDLFVPGITYVQRCLANGARPSGWPARGRALVAAGGQRNIEALSDGTGGVLVKWEANGRIAELRVRANGTNAAGDPSTGRILMSGPATGGSATGSSLA